MYMVTLCSPLKVKQNFRGHVVSIFRLTLKMSATCFSETSVDFDVLLDLLSQKMEALLITASRTSNPTNTTAV
jgi:hypothetical protein